MLKKGQAVLAGLLVILAIVVSGTKVTAEDAAGAKSARYVRPTGQHGSYKFVGSRKAKEYHWPACKYAKSITPEDRITFTSAQEAQSQGYVHCKVCSKFRL